MATHSDLTPAQREDITRQVADFLTTASLTQQQFADRVGLPQPFICSVLQGNFVKSTPRTRRLLEYIHIMSRGPEAAGAALGTAIEEYLAAGGDLSILRSSIEMMTIAYRSSAAMRGD